MSQELNYFISEILGLNANPLNLWQMGAGAIVVYSVGLILVRTAGDRHFIGKYAAFDVILSIILGSTVSRTINGSALFFPSLVAAFVLVAMHWLVAAISFRLARFETLIKGNPRILIQDRQLY